MSICICQFCGRYLSSKCGYCKNDDKSLSKYIIGAYFTSISNDVYEELMFRQWQRCGNYYYQPQNHEICCPQYHSRINVKKFIMVKKHKKVVKKVERYLEGQGKWKKSGKVIKKRKNDDDDGKRIVEVDRMFEKMIERLMDEGKLGKIDIKELGLIRSKIDYRGKSDLIVNVGFVLNGKYKQQQQQEKEKKIVIMKPKEISKIIIENYVMDQKNDVITSIKMNKNGFIHVDVIDEIKKKYHIQQMKEKKEKKGKKDKKKKKKKEEEKEEVKEVVKKEEVKEVKEEVKKEEVKEEGKEEGKKEEVKEDRKENEKKNESEEELKNDFKDEIIISIEKPVADIECVNMYTKYQWNVHGNNPDKLVDKGLDFKKFLCDTTLMYEKGPLKGKGSFHLKYRLKSSKKLIALSVIDVLKSGISSVYFFYDTDFFFLSLGRYSALTEIELIKKESEKFPDFKYYYMGYYVHDCKKMNYKSQYKPTEILCSETWKWVDVEICKKKLDKVKHTKFIDDEPKAVAYKCENPLLLFDNNIIRKDLMVNTTGMDFTEATRKKNEQFHSSCGPISENIAFFLRNGEVEMNPIMREIMEAEALQRTIQQSIMQQHTTQQQRNNDENNNNENNNNENNNNENNNNENNNNENNNNNVVTTSEQNTEDNK